MNETANDNSTVLAVDIGTSSVRSIEFDRAGRVLRIAREAYPVISSAGGLEEQDPQIVWHGVRNAIAHSLSGTNRVRALSFSSQMYGVFPVDSVGQPLARNMLWSDSRATSQAAEAKKTLDVAEVTRTTGCPVSSIYPRYKLKWLSQNDPHLFESAARFVSIKDYVVHQLTGRWVTDPSLASGTGLLDISRAQWDEAALAWAGLTAERLPEIVSCTAQMPVTNARLASELALGPDVVVVPGGGDGPLANLGSGASRQGEVNVDLGTSGAARVVVDSIPSGDDGLWCYCLDQELWVVGGILTNVGNAWQWAFRELLNKGSDPSVDIFQRAAELVKGIPPCSDGLMFLPFLRAPRSPYWDDSLAGTILGLRAHHSVAHMVRALGEAIAFDLAVVLGLLASNTELKLPVRMTGGVTSNEFLAQLIADVTGLQMVVPSSTEGSAGGAAILGFKALGLIEDLHFTEVAPVKQLFIPNASLGPTYASGLKRYQSLVQRMREVYAEVGQS